ncbi:MAG: PfkB family carbohydrate kinase [Pseudomonadota bacterium]
MTGIADKAPVLCVGRLYCDLIFTDLPRMPTLGTEVFTEGFGAHAGGGAFITAAHLAQLGHVSALAAMLPASPFGDLMRDDLAASGVDLSLCAPLSPAQGPQITVSMAQADDRAFLTRRAGAALPSLSAEEVAKRGFRHIHVGEIATLVEHPEIVAVARAQNASLSADCAWDDAFDAQALRPFIGELDIFLPNEVEYEVLRAAGIDDRIAKTVVIKRGALGATLIHDGGTLTAPALATDVLDTTGAGDAFNAGFLSRWLEGAPPQACLEAGNRLGAQAVATRGGFAKRAVPVSEMGFVGE